MGKDALSSPTAGRFAMLLLIAVLLIGVRLGFGAVRSTEDASRPAYGMWDRVDIGMSRDQVRAELGEPLRVAIERRDEIWIYPDRLHVVLQGNSLVEIGIDSH